MSKHQDIWRRGHFEDTSGPIGETDDEQAMEVVRRKNLRTSDSHLGRKEIFINRFL